MFQIKSQQDRKGGIISLWFVVETQHKKHSNEDLK